MIRETGIKKFIITYTNQQVLVWLIILSSSIAKVSAQSKLLKWLKTENDTAFIEDHTENITFRLYGSRKYTKYDIVDTKQKRDIQYRPATPFNLGIGINYQHIGLNLGFNLPFINQHIYNKFGRTRYLDLQSHLYLRKLVVDFYGQYYKGYYIANSSDVFGKAYAAVNPYPQRPDIKNLNLGINVQYIFNDKKFSYRASNLQNEYQKKSAGSFVVGAEIFTVKIEGDSSLIPANISDTDFLRDKHFYRSGIISAAANFGYAYTFVVKKHLFLSLSFTGGLGSNQTRLFFENGYNSRNTGLQFSNTFRGSIGYNSSLYFAGIHYVGMTIHSKMPIPKTYQIFGTGNFRVSLVRRFKVKKPLWKMKEIGN